MLQVLYSAKFPGNFIEWIWTKYQLSLQYTSEDGTITFVTLEEEKNLSQYDLTGDVNLR